MPEQLVNAEVPAGSSSGVMYKGELKRNTSHWSCLLNHSSYSGFRQQACLSCLNVMPFIAILSTEI